MADAEPSTTHISAEDSNRPPRERILQAAFSAFMERGYAGTSTLEIATRARVSKRELYTLFGSKQAMLAACIGARVQRMRPPADLPPARDARTLATVLKRFGANLLRELSNSAVMAVYRLAIAEAEQAPEVARTLDQGRGATRTAFAELLAQAQSARLLGPGEPRAMTEQFFALLCGDLMMDLLLKVSDVPTPTELERRANTATQAFLKLHLRCPGNLGAAAPS